MDQLTLQKRKKPEITEEDVIDSLERALKAYSKKDFSNIVSPAEFNPKKVSTKRISKAKPSKTISKKVVSKKKNGYSFFKKSLKKSKIVEKPEKKMKTNRFAGLQNFYSMYRKQVMTSVLSLAMLSFAGFSGYIAYAYVAAGNSDILGKVAQHVVLPVGETPKVYIIQSEKSEIFQNPLFNGIQVGDNVLSYTNSSKVIIYRGSEDKVVNIVNTTQ